MRSKARFGWFGVLLLTSLLGFSGCRLEARQFSQGEIERSEESVPAAQQEQSIAEEQQEQETPSMSADRYAYGTLSETAKRVYDEIYLAESEHQERIKVSTLDVNVLDEAYKAVSADYGGIFWTSGYVYTQYTKGDELVEIEFSPKYTMGKEEREAVQGQIDARVSEILSGLSPEASDYEKTKYVFEYLASNVDYELGSPDNQNIISALLNGKTVCQGYASATQYLLDVLGIQSSVVTGRANGESHAWNLVRMDGAYYYVDTTWGNSIYNGAVNGMNRFVNYNYFGVTSEEIMRTHTANDYFVLPECTAMENNYYVREGRYLDSWNPDAVGALCRNAYSGGGAVSVKFATAELYQQYRQYFISEEHIADYCSGISSLYYVEDTQQNVLTFSFS